MEVGRTPRCNQLGEVGRVLEDFRTGCLMLEIATAASLDRYVAEFRTRVMQHPGAWFLAAQADIRCRSEFWTQERGRQEEFHLSHPSMSAYNPSQPWNSVIRSGSSRQEFWSKEFDKPALMYQMQGGKQSPPT